jgi:hypothetical protein
MVLVDSVRYAGLEGDRRKLRRAWQSHFDVTRLVGFREGQFVAGQRAHLTQLLCDDSRNTADRSCSFISSFPVSGYGVAEVEAFDGVGEIAHEIAAAKFAIGENLETEFFLFGEDTLDVLVFEFPEAFGICAGLTCLEQVRWPKKTANVIGAVRYRHAR